jgi:hypothetical protein
MYRVGGQLEMRSSDWPPACCQHWRSSPRPGRKSKKLLLWHGSLVTIHTRRIKAIRSSSSFSLRTSRIHWARWVGFQPGSLQPAQARETKSSGHPESFRLARLLPFISFSPHPPLHQHISHTSTDHHHDVFLFHIATLFLTAVRVSLRYWVVRVIASPAHVANSSEPTSSRLPDP